ncbi:hypothetical protein BC941DRAFT_427224 [Chlamydoabsidia padenii]|nr:hypothetical protein BC941DRAFT_427224 [Chlamydoabsidia padenii]
MLGSDQHWEQGDDILAPSSPPKKKSMERLSRLFQKKSKHKKSTAEENNLLPDPPMYSSSVSRQSSLHSSQSSSRFNSASKKGGGGESLKRLATIRPSKTIPELRQEVEQKQRILQRLEEEKRQQEEDNQRREQDLQRLQQRTQDRIIATTQLQTQYDTHLASLRATSDDLASVRNKVIQIQQNITDLADRLLPHASTDTTSVALASFWLNLRQVIEPMCPLSPTTMRHLTEKFIMDVLVQNFNLSEIAGCTCSDDYAQLALWFLDHDTDDKRLLSPSSHSITSSSSSSSICSSAATLGLSDAMIFSIRLRQQVASTVVAAQQHDETVKQELQQVVQGHWKYLYGGLAKAYPYIYHHDTTLETDVRKHFGAQIQGLVEQAVALGFAIKGLEMDITAADVQEGTQQLDLALMDDLLGNKSGIIQFCISPPFRIFNQHDPLVKGKVLCASTTTNTKHTTTTNTANTTTTTTNTTFNTITDTDTKQ